jgi:hypothetical protein
LLESLAPLYKRLLEPLLPAIAEARQLIVSPDAAL